jgi:pimeloyl-ACP methyl ester carboxylesterase/ribosomal protein S18 acetylase RimI-like enzyme
VGVQDDDLTRFEVEGAPPLPIAHEQGYVENAGARIWYAAYGTGAPVILLHGGLGNSGNWGHQVPALIGAGCRVVVIDSRGHGRSTRDARPYSYQLMASDVSAVMNALGIATASLVGWSDGACTALVLASTAPARVAGVFFFACKMDPGGAKDFVFTPNVGRCLNRHKQDYARLSATPHGFDDLFQAVNLMQRTQPNYSSQDLAAIDVPVTIAHSEHDEFIKPDHAEYLARSIPNATLVHIDGVSHFAPLQRPELFTNAVLRFLGRAAGRATIRRAELTDLANVETIARTTWPMTYAGIIPDEVQRGLLDRWYSPESLRRDLGAPDTTFLVAERSGTIVGFAQYVRRSAESVELTRIYVLPDGQRGGIGGRLLDAALAKFADEGLRLLTVCVERDNAIGRRFYEKMRFAEPRALTQTVLGYALALIEYRRPIP